MATAQSARGLVSDVLHSFQRSPIFTFYVVTTLVVSGVVGLITFDIIDLGMAHFGELSHRTHDVAYGLLFATSVVGMLAQLRRPRHNVAGMTMALIPAASLLLAAVLSSDLDSVVRFNPLRYAAAVIVVAALVHPAGREFFSSFNVSRTSPAMIGLVVIASVPLLAFALASIRLQRTDIGMHTFMGHYGFMAAFSFTVIGVSVLASLRPDGWRLTAWVAGLLPATLGIVSFIYPDASSSLTGFWAFAAMAWGAAFITTAELTRPGATTDSIVQASQH